MHVLPQVQERVKLALRLKMTHATRCLAALQQELPAEDWAAGQLQALSLASQQALGAQLQGSDSNSSPHWTTCGAGP